MGGKPKTNTAPDRRLKQNKRLRGLIISRRRLSPKKRPKPYQPK